MPDNMTVAQRSRTMSRIRSCHTKPELAVRKALFARGLRYRTHCVGLPGNPDIVFVSSKVAVFVDGDFWHGWQWKKWLHKLPSDYWKQKIHRNRARDAANRRLLKKAGWHVIRLWEHQVKKAFETSIDRIERAVRFRRPNPASPKYLPSTRRRDQKVIDASAASSLGRVRVAAAKSQISDVAN